MFIAGIDFTQQATIHNKTKYETSSSDAYYANSQEISGKILRSYKSYVQDTHEDCAPILPLGIVAQMKA